MNGDDAGKWPLPFGDQQISINQLPFGRNLDMNVQLSVVVFFNGLQCFDRWSLNQRRPFTKSLMPAFLNFLTATSPIGNGLDLSSIFK